MRYPSGRLLVSVASIVLAVTACTTSRTEAPVLPTSIPPPTSATSPQDISDPSTDGTNGADLLPIDQEVRKGELDNGLTYYLRHNDSPGRRAELRLLVNAGSVQEDEDQAGVAHFLEHMMFNGTEQFPRNELIAALESFGPRFGPDINAFTTYDETIYELSLSSDNEELIDLGVEVLREWASLATLTEQDVFEERGVVLDEWRLRAQGFNGRLAEAFQILWLTGTSYEGKAPIGDADSIQATSSDQLLRFYEKWYRPDLMAVVAVGDFDLNEMEARITRAFGDLVRPVTSQPWEPVTYEPSDDPSVIGFTDREAASASVTVLWPGSPRGTMTIGDYQSTVARSIALGILSQRLNDDALRGVSSFLGSADLGFSVARAVQLEGVAVDARPRDVEDALSAVLIEVERIRQFGIGDEEFDRAIAAFKANSEQRYEQRGSVQNARFAAQIAAHHLAGAHLMSPDQRFQVESGVLEVLTRSEIEAALESIAAAAPIIMAIGPDDAAAVVPEAERILELINEVASTPVNARPQSSPVIDSLMAKPNPVPVVGTEVDETFEYVTLTFDNGATVFLWQSDIVEETVFVAAESFGGTSQIAIEDLPEAFLVTDIIGRSGVGPADAATLQRLLAERVVQLTPFISETREGLTGGAAAKDVEILFQLIHLYMTAPRFEEVAIAAVLDEMETLNASRDDLGGILFDEATDAGYYGDDPRYFVFPSSAQLAVFDIQAAETVYRDRFGNAGDFAFAFVGDLELEVMTELAASYIGTLPGEPKREGFVDHQPLPPREVQISVVEAGSDPQGLVGMFFTNEFEPMLEDRLTARTLELIVNVRLRNRIREELSATYSVTAGIDLQRDPDPFAESFVTATGHPDDLARISDEIMADLVDLQTHGPTEQQFATAIEQLRTELELINNGTLADALLTSYLYPDQPVTELAQRTALIDQVTAADVQSLARIAFNPDQRIEVRLVPRP